MPVEDREAREGEGCVEEAVEDEDAINPSPTAAASTAVTTSTPAAQILWIRIRRDLVRTRLPELTPPVKAARRCEHVCGSRYADDMRPL